MIAQELRLGNWVQYTHNKQLVKIRQLRTELIEVYHNPKQTGFCSYEDIKPIPLTEEILLKCGFEKINAYAFRKKGFILNGRKVKDSIGFHFTHYECTVEYQHLHQLQNLYFALTGQELNIEL